jgi:hypothetical protein
MLDLKASVHLEKEELIVDEQAPRSYRRTYPIARASSSA